MATTAINAETEHHRRFIDEYQHLSRPFGSGSFGARAEALARFFGPPTFLIGQTLIVGTWIVLNAAKIVHFDPYPFILLNLAFSAQAAYAAPLILLAQTRQADRDKAHAEADARHREELSQRSLEQAAQMQKLLESNTKMTEETRKLAEHVDRLTQEIHG